ncbi:unnamed protein product [Caretta caretta]
MDVLGLLEEVFAPFTSANLVGRESERSLMVWNMHPCLSSVNALYKGGYFTKVAARLRSLGFLARAASAHELVGELGLELGSSSATEFMPLNNASPGMNGDRSGVKGFISQAIAKIIILNWIIGLSSSIPSGGKICS